MWQWQRQTQLAKAQYTEEPSPWLQTPLNCRDRGLIMDNELKDEDWTDVLVLMVF
jgi:hypothetical protein